ncbi:hypothetical protein NA57DRAFT_71692 [Rhizodiscina lignyota]|uniref:DUF1275 domain protein n=1 Tax=Rhizodiscina lignyota TaxID=1504668 RepID=A0A9P4IR30_9PEZI|nr:hypothetical protein NA57DRAFT_71692 [Rhizodiscina lignyota]
MAYFKRIFTPQYILEPIQPTFGDLALLVCCFVSGMTDAVSFDNWGVFVGMQTGNTVLLGLSAASLPRGTSYVYAKTLVSISSFLVGAFTIFLFHRLTLPFGPKATNTSLLRLHIVFSFTAQTLVLVLAAALCSTSLVPQDSLGGNDSILNDHRILTALPPLAFQSGMQIATGRLLGFGELPTIVLTSVYCDLMNDAVGLKLKNKKRDRRVGAVVLLVSGAIVAGWLLRACIGVHGVLWIAVGLKALTSIGMWLGLRSVDVKSEGRR